MDIECIINILKTAILEYALKNRLDDIVEGSFFDLSLACMNEENRRF
jgi:hypothetical protein